MPLPQERVLRNDVFKAERRLSEVEAQFGKDSPEYQDALQKFARLWNVLRLTRTQDDFLHEVIK